MRNQKNSVHFEIELFVIKNAGCMPVGLLPGESVPGEFTYHRPGGPLGPPEG